MRTTVFLMFVVMFVVPIPTFAASKKQIQDNNTQAIVYLEITDKETGQVVDSGSGALVSHDGYVITVNHLKATPNQTMWAVVGARFGTRFPLVFREADANNDVALWQFPQSQTCRSAVTLTKKRVEVHEPVLAIGFPSESGLTPANSSIINLQSERGFYKVDGQLESGFSGGPVFNEEGKVIGLVQGGKLPGTQNNDIVPISLAISLISKRNVLAGIESETPFNEACYASCRHPTDDFEAECRKIAAGAGGNAEPVEEIVDTGEHVCTSIGQEKKVYKTVEAGEGRYFFNEQLGETKYGAGSCEFNSDGGGIAYETKRICAIDAGGEKECASRLVKVVIRAFADCTNHLAKLGTKILTQCRFTAIRKKGISQ